MRGLVILAVVVLVLAAIVTAQPGRSYGRRCPNGLPGYPRCSPYGRRCPGYKYCINGVCCRQGGGGSRRCPDGSYGFPSCSRWGRRCRGNKYCYNGVCCRRGGGGYPF